MGAELDSIVYQRNFECAEIERLVSTRECRGRTRRDGGSTGSDPLKASALSLTSSINSTKIHFLDFRSWIYKQSLHGLWNKHWRDSSRD
jgi:hypothetical protein